VGDVRVVAVIPVRYGSSRFPGKPLADICGRPMVQWVYEQAVQARVDRVLVATDDARIKTAVEDFGGEAVLTSSEHRSGTERVAEVAAGLEAEVVVNVQGDEPLIRPEMIDRAVEALLEDEEVMVSSLRYPIERHEDWLDPHIVKVVCDQADFALYFSRAPIPCNTREKEMYAWKHIGLYVYRRNFLALWARLEPTPLEVREGLEQLRILEHGYRIKVVESPHDSLGVDTPEDINKVIEVIGNAKKK